MSIKHTIFVAAAVLGSATQGVRCGCNARAAHADSARSENKAECPDFVRGAKLALREVNGGVELKITTPWTIHLTPLRQLLHQLAVVVEEHTRRAEPRDGELEIPPVDIAIRDVTSGSLIVVRADDRLNVPVLREQAKLLGEFWSSSACINGTTGQVASL